MSRNDVHVEIDAQCATRDFSYTTSHSPTTTLLDTGSMRLVICRPFVDSSIQLSPVATSIKYLSKTFYAYKTVVDVLVKGRVAARKVAAFVVDERELNIGGETFGAIMGLGRPRVSVSCGQPDAPVISRFICDDLRYLTFDFRNQEASMTANAPKAIMHSKFEPLLGLSESIHQNPSETLWHFVLRGQTFDTGASQSLDVPGVTRIIGLPELKKMQMVSFDLRANTVGMLNGPECADSTCDFDSSAPFFRGRVSGMGPFHF